MKQFWTNVVCGYWKVLEKSWNCFVSKRLWTLYGGGSPAACNSINEGRWNKVSVCIFGTLIRAVSIVKECEFLSSCMLQCCPLIGFLSVSLWHYERSHVSCSGLVCMLWPCSYCETVRRWISVKLRLVGPISQFSGHIAALHTKMWPILMDRLVWFDAKLNSVLP